LCGIYHTDAIKSPVHLSIGQESIAAGICDPLNPDDIVSNTYRCHATYITKGGDLKQMRAKLYGKEAGCAAGKAGSMHLIDMNHGVMGASAVVGITIPVAAGYALALKNDAKITRVQRFVGIKIRFFKRLIARWIHHRAAEKYHMLHLRFKGGAKQQRIHHRVIGMDKGARHDILGARRSRRRLNNNIHTLEQFFDRLLIAQIGFVPGYAFAYIRWAVKPHRMHVVFPLAAKYSVILRPTNPVAPQTSNLGFMKFILLSNFITASHPGWLRSLKGVLFVMRKMHRR